MIYNRRLNIWESKEDRKLRLRRQAAERSRERKRIKEAEKEQDLWVGLGFELPGQ